MKRLCWGISLLVVLQPVFAMEIPIDAQVINVPITIDTIEEQTQSAERKNSNKAIDEVVKNLNLGTATFDKLEQIYQGLDLMPSSEIEILLSRISQMKQSDESKIDVVLQEIQRFYNWQQNVIQIDENRDKKVRDCRKILKYLIPPAVCCLFCAITATGYIIVSWRENG